MAFKGGVVLGTVSFNATGSGTTNIGATSNSGTISIGNTSSAAVAINCGTAGITIGTTANAHTTTLGSTNTTSTTNLQAGSGGVNVSNFLTLPTSTSSATGIIKIGPNVRIHNYGADADSNLFIGKTAGNFTLTTGSSTNNVGMGRSVLSALTTGTFNTSLGDSALAGVTTGTSNVAVGAFALNVGGGSGGQNVAVGTNTLQQITTGIRNTCIGQGAGLNYTTSESYNIILSSSVDPGVVGESNRFRVGSGTGTGVGQVDATYISGITGKSTAAASNVTLTDTGNKLGTVAGGAVTFNTGTQSLSISSDASATTVNLATGAAAKTVTLGSTNSTSLLALKYGTADFSLASATGNVMVALDTGEITYPLQPAFSAYLASSDANATGDGTTYTIGGVTALTEIYDQNGDFNTNGTFTAPVTGRYNLACGVSINGPGAANSLFVDIVTSNRTYHAASIVPFTIASGGNFDIVFAIFADMDASDTATATVQVTGGTKTIQINGAATVFTYFQGTLDC